MSIEATKEQKLNEMASALFGVNWRGYVSPIEEIETMAILHELLDLKQDVQTRKDIHVGSMERMCV